MNLQELMDKRNGEMIYCHLYDWLTTFSLGEYRRPSSYKWYSKRLFFPLLEIINSLETKNQLNEIENNFLNNVQYKGKIFRIHNYNPRKRKYVYEINYFSHWSSNIEGLSNLNLSGQKLLLVGNVDKSNPGINIYGLLYFLLQNVPKMRFNERPLPNLQRYCRENEIVAPVNKNTIQDILIVDSKSLSSNNINGTQLPLNKWYRKSRW